MKRQTKFLYFALWVLFFAGLNFYFTNLISYKLEGGWKFSSNLLNIVYAENTGAAFSIMQNSTKFLMILSVIALVAIFYFVLKNLSKLALKELFFVSFLITGIVGNLYERLFFGHVRDFFELAFMNFPIFNISDVFINIGVLGIIILILLSKKSGYYE